MCGGSETNPPTFSQRRERHQAFLAQLLADAVEHLARIAASYSPQGEQEWRKIAANAVAPPPMPCLSCAPPQVYPIAVVVPFADGTDTFDANDPKIQTALAAIKDGIARQPPTAQGKIRVRGHADTKERDVDRVALARAKAVVGWLGKNGVDPKRLEPVGLGAEAAIANGGTPEGAAQNRRVDIEFVETPRVP
jgi:outer membrane protein OmpA-like peptidoglycan-associated protein